MIEILALIALVMIVFFWEPYIGRTTKLGAPFVPAEPEVVARIIKLAQIKKGQIFYDLGSGDGRLVIYAAMQGAKAYGVEIDRLRVFYSRLWIKFLGLSQKAQIIQKNFFEVDLSEADVVCLFLLQETNQKLKEKIKREVKKGALVISYAFTFENWKPKLADPNPGSIYGPIFVYQK